MKKLFTAASIVFSLFITRSMVRVVYADTGATKDIYMYSGSGSRRNQPLSRLTTDGMLLPGTASNAFDLGSSSYPFGNIYGGNMNLTPVNAALGLLTIGASTQINLAQQVTPFVVNFPTITIPYTGNYILIQSSALNGGSLITALPNVSTASARNGDILFIENLSSNPISIADQGSLTNSGFKLLTGISSRTFDTDNVGMFIFRNGNWRELTHETH